MRDEKEIEEQANKISSMLSRGVVDPHDKTMLTVDGGYHLIDNLRGLLAALDWVLDEEDEDLI